jgi:hypothetical protein
MPARGTGRRNLPTALRLLESGTEPRPCTNPSPDRPRRFRVCECRNGSAVPEARPRPTRRGTGAFAKHGAAAGARPNAGPETEPAPMRVRGWSPPAMRVRGWSPPQCGSGDGARPNAGPETEPAPMRVRRRSPPQCGSGDGARPRLYSGAEADTLQGPCPKPAPWRGRDRSPSLERPRQRTARHDSPEPSPSAEPGQRPGGAGGRGRNGPRKTAWPGGFPADCRKTSRGQYGPSGTRLRRGPRGPCRR